MNNNVKEEITQEERMRYIDGDLNDMMGILIPDKAGSEPYIVHSDEWIKWNKAKNGIKDISSNANSVPIFNSNIFATDIDDFDDEEITPEERDCYIDEDFSDINGKPVYCPNGVAYVVHGNKWIKNIKAREREQFAKESEVLKEFKKILTSEVNKDSDCVSLYDLAKLVIVKEKEYDNCKRVFMERFNSEYRHGNVSYCEYYPKNDKLIIRFKEHFIDEEGCNLIFTEKDGLQKEDNNKFVSDKVLIALKDLAPQLYDVLKQYKDYKTQHVFNINPVNSNLLASITREGVCISNKEHSYSIADKKFELNLSSCFDEYHYFHDCKSYSDHDIGIFLGNEDEIFKKIFVKIEDCPEWSRDYLYEIRQNQLEEEKTKLNEQVQSEEMLYRKKSIHY